MFFNIYYTFLHYKNPKILVTANIFELYGILKQGSISSLIVKGNQEKNWYAGTSIARIIFLFFFFLQ